MMRDGWERPLHLDIESEAGAWRGTWRAPQQGSDMALREVDVRGEDVRFDTDKLRFFGRLSGNRLSGTVVDLPAGLPAGEFSLARDQPEPLPDY